MKNIIKLLLILILLLNNISTLYANSINLTKRQIHATQNLNLAPTTIFKELYNLNIIIPALESLKKTYKSNKFLAIIPQLIIDYLNINNKNENFEIKTETNIDKIKEILEIWNKQNNITATESELNDKNIHADSLFSMFYIQKKDEILGYSIILQYGDLLDLYNINIKESAQQNGLGRILSSKAILEFGDKYQFATTLLYSGKHQKVQKKWENIHSYLGFTGPNDMHSFRRMSPVAKKAQLKRMHKFIALSKNTITKSKNTLKYVNHLENDIQDIINSNQDAGMIPIINNIIETIKNRYFKTEVIPQRLIYLVHRKIIDALIENGLLPSDKKQILKKNQINSAA